MGAAADKCCASERDRGETAADLRSVRFDGEESDATETSSEKVREKMQVLRRASGSSASRKSTQSSETAPEDAAASGAPAVKVTAPDGEPAESSSRHSKASTASDAKQKGARLLKAGLKTGEVSKLVDAKEAEEAAAKAGKSGGANEPEDDNLFEF
eukprot:gb/GFBE01020547.1/.p1 GENE.gb/GFBE01020547.1/~~gb/GFBE01020547.1/.p1  ORF type:complete len:156 (+),score=43.56 gb/GFBE01020547.1/:1-468(+)